MLGKHLEADAISTDWVFSIGLSKLWTQGDLKIYPSLGFFYSMEPGIPDPFISDLTQAAISKWPLVNS